MTDFNLDEFFDQALAWQDGSTKQVPEYLAERLYVDKARMPPLPGSGQTATNEQFQYQEFVEMEKKRRELAAYFLFRIDPDEPSAAEMLLDRIRETPIPGRETTDIPPKPKKKPVRDYKAATAFLASVEEVRERLAKEQNRPAEDILDKEAILSVDTSLWPRKPNGKPVGSKTAISFHSKWKTLKKWVDKYEDRERLEKPQEHHPLLDGLARYFD